MTGTLMEREMREQPTLLAANGESYLQQFQPLRGNSYDLVLLAARGTSDNAALYARYLIEVHLKVPVTLAAPSVFTRYAANPRYPRTLAIGISQSGAAPDVAEVLHSLRSQGHTTLGITNTPDSKLTRTAEHTLLLSVGEENAVAATKTYTSSLLALYQLVRVLGADLPPCQLPGDVWLEECRSAAERDLPVLLRNAILFSLGRGYSFGTAHECALKLMECACLPCLPYSVADFQHGPRALAGPVAAAILYESQPDCSPHLECVEAPRPEVTEEVVPIWYAYYAQWLALLASRARGFDPDRPVGLQKVTETL